MTPQEIASRYREKQVFKRLLEEQAEDAGFAIAKIKGDEHTQRIYGNKYISNTSIEKTSAWLSTFIGKNNNVKK